MKKSIFGVSVAMILAAAAQGQSSNQPPSRFAWQSLQANEVQAGGWLKVQATEDLCEGLPGRLDEINTDVTQKKFALQETDLKTTWARGEQEAYWYEGKVHLAFLANDPVAIQKVTEWVDAILKRQAANTNHYLGIYDAESRLLPADNPVYGDRSGELHTQGNAFLALLAFYEHTGRADVLAAVERAAQLTMKTYDKGMFGTAGKHTPKAGGNSHAVTFADPMIQLYRLTGNEAYLNFVGKMYEDYNLHPPRDQDLTRKVLTDPAALFTGHGAHTAESFHIVQAAALTGDKEMKKLPALANAKLLTSLTPSGALISDESIHGYSGNGTHFYEHCTQTELVKSFLFMMEYTGDPAMADRAARLFFNAIQGARLHPLVAVQYLSCDDRLDIPGPMKDPVKMRKFRMSSIIRATCCSGSAGRGLPYYLAGSWMKSPDGKTLAAMNFAPCSIATTVAGTGVKIHEETEYPFSDQITLTINPDRPVDFDVVLRPPAEGSIKIISDSGAKVSGRNGFLVLNKKWQTGDKVELALDLPVVLEKTQEGKAQYYRRGALVFALPFQSEIKPIKENPRWDNEKPSGLFEYEITVPDKSAWGYRIDSQAKFEPVKLAGDNSHPWQKPTLGLKGMMLDAEDKSVPVMLVPEGAAISRRVTFLDTSHSAEEAARLPKDEKITNEDFN